MVFTTKEHNNIKRNNTSKRIEIGTNVDTFHIGDCFILVELFFIFRSQIKLNTFPSYLI